MGTEAILYPIEIEIIFTGQLYKKKIYFTRQLYKEHQKAPRQKNTTSQ